MLVTKLAVLDDMSQKSDGHNQNAVRFSAIQNTYLHGRSESFKLGGKSAYVYFELSFQRSINFSRLEAAWKHAHNVVSALNYLPVAEGVLHLVDMVSPLVVVDLSHVSVAQSISDVRQLRRQIKLNRISMDEYRAVDGTLIKLPGKRSRLSLRFDLIIFDAARIAEFIGELNSSYHRSVDDELDYEVFTEEKVESAEYKFLSPSSTNIEALGLSEKESPRFPLTNKKNLSVWESSGIELPEILPNLERCADRSGFSLQDLIAFCFAETLSTWSTEKNIVIPIMSSSAASAIGNRSALRLFPFNKHLDEVERSKSIIERWQASAKVWQDYQSHCGHDLLRQLAKAKGGTDGSPVPYALSININSNEDWWQKASEWDCEIEQFVIDTPFVLLDVQLFRKGNGLYLHYDHFADAFDAGIPEAMLRQFASNLKRLASKPAVLLSKGFPALPVDQELQRDQINSRQKVVDPEERLHSGFYRQSDLVPDNVAIYSERKILTYRELQHRSSHLAQLLKAGGHVRGDIVAVLMEKGWEQVAACLGILEAGGAYLPISADLPTERITYLLNVCNVKHVLKQSWISLNQDPIQARCKTIDVDSLIEFDTKPQLESMEQSDIAYLIFTSGSTGVPKGVVIDHLGAVNTVIDINERFNVTSADRCLAISNLNFDLSVYDIFGLLAVGGSLVMPSQNENSDPRSWLQLCRKYDVTIWNSVPAIFNLAVNRLETFDEVFPKALRLVMMSGDWIPIDLPNRVWSMGAKPQLVSLGGATEGSIWSIFHVIDQVRSSWTSIPYGQPLTNQWFAVRDQNDEDCPVGVAGEIYIGGTGVALGYWQDSERSAKSFSICPKSGNRLYRTGDLGRYLSDGSIEFLGRLDCQVKVNGYRVELGEIEAALNEHPYISQSVVTCYGERFAKKQLVAYLVPRSGNLKAQIDNGSIIEYLSGSLPHYMVPLAFEEISALPLSPNGKIDRSKLPAPKFGKSNSPSISFEDQLVNELNDIFAETIGLRAASVDDGFFSLGGDSLGAINVIAQIERRHKHVLSMSEFVTANSLSTLAEIIKKGSKKKESALIRFHDVGDKPYLVFFYPVGGQLVCYRHLAEALKDEFRLVGIPSSASGQALTMNDMAKESFSLLQSEGIEPQLLIGWSFGGFLALEVARLFSKLKKHAAKVLMLDSGPSEKLASEWRTALLVSHFIKDITEAGRHGFYPESTTLEGLSVDEALAKAIELASAQGRLLHVERERLRKHYETYRRNMLALATHMPETFFGDVHLGWSSEEPQPVINYWVEREQVLRHFQISGNHFDVLKPKHVDQIVSYIRTNILPPVNKESLQYGIR
jgi:pyochelin synthetase